MFIYVALYHTADHDGILNIFCMSDDKFWNLVISPTLRGSEGDLMVNAKLLRNACEPSQLA